MTNEAEYPERQSEEQPSEGVLARLATSTASLESPDGSHAKDIMPAAGVAPQAPVTLTTKPTRRGRWGRGGMWTARVALVIIMALGATLSLTPFGRAATRAALLFEPLIAADQPADLQVVGEPIRHTSTTLTTPYDNVYLDVYAPATSAPPIPHAREGIIIIPGVGDNRQAQQLINLSESLARAGIVVVNMTTDILIDFTISTLDSEALVRTYQWLARQPNVDAHRIGFLGLSGGGDLSCFAAIDPRIRDSVAFIILFGSYYNATDMLRDMGRRAILVNGRLQPWEPVFAPNDVPGFVLAHAVAATLPPDQGDVLLNALGPSEQLPTSAQLAQLPTSVQAAYHLLIGDQPAQANANIAALSPAMRAALLQLSPSSIASDIRTPIYLLHDVNDQYVPYTESRDFDAALTRLGHRHEFVEFTIFSHVEVRPDLGLGPLLGDGARLYRILYEILLPAS